MAKQNPNNVEKERCPECGRAILNSSMKNHLNQHKQGLMKTKNDNKINAIIKPIVNDKKSSSPAVIHLIDRKKKQTITPDTTNKNIKKNKKKKKDVKKPTYDTSMTKEIKQPESKPLLDPKKILSVRFNIDSLEFMDGTFITPLYQYENKTDKNFRSAYNNLKDLYKTKYENTIVLEVVEDKSIRENENLYRMRERFFEIYRETFEVKCDICNVYFHKDKIDEHKLGCEAIVIPTKIVENYSGEIIVNKPDDYQNNRENTNIPTISKGKKEQPKRDGIHEICKSIQDQSNAEKNCKYKTVGRIQAKNTIKENKLFWLYNDMPKNTTIKNDMHGNPINVTSDPNISKVINGTPISKNHKVVYDLLSSKNAKNNTGKAELLILNKASYFNASDGRTKGVEIQSRITKSPVLWACLENLILQIEEINKHGVRQSERELIQKLLGIVKGATTEELFADIKPFIRKALELRGLGYLKNDQEDVKRSHIFDGCTLVIDGGPGTGKTTSLVQRIRFLTSPAALISYQIFTDENDELYKSLINTKNQNWIFYSPTQLLADYLKSNMASEGLETGPNYVKVWNEHLFIIAKDYFGNFSHAKTNYFKQESFKDVSTAFRTYVFQYIKKKYFKDNRNQVFTTPEIKTIFQRIETFKTKLNIDENLLNLERSYNSISQNYKDEIEIIITKGKKIHNEFINDILGNISDEDKNNLVIEIKKSSKDDDFKKVSLEKVVEGLIRKKINILSGKKVKFNELEKAFDVTLNIDIDIITAVYISESEQFEELYQDYFKNFDSQYLQYIFKIYQQFRECTEVESLRANIDPKQWGKDELAFMIGEINDYIISRRLFETKMKYVNIYKQYVKNIIAVDEASDLNLYDLKCIYSFRHWKKNSVTFCGDILQRMTKDGIKDWDDLKPIIENTEILKLKISYRQSPTLLDVARKIHKHVTQYDADYKPYLSKQSFEPKPLLYINKEEDIRLKWVIERLYEIFRAYGNKMPSTALFVTNANEIERFSERINAFNNNRSIKIEGYNNQKNLHKMENTVAIFPIDEIKGLEFEAVIFVDLNEILQSNLEEDLLLRYIYIGLSRAAYYFGITGSEKFTGSLKFLNSAFYEKGTWS